VKTLLRCEWYVIVFALNLTDTFQNNVIIFIDTITVYVESNIILLDCVSLR